MRMPQLELVQESRAIRGVGRVPPLQDHHPPVPPPPLPDPPRPYAASSLWAFANLRLNDGDVSVAGEVDSAQDAAVGRCMIDFALGGQETAARTKPGEGHSERSRVLKLGW